ncbi:S9 family peptidase [Hymenobacter lapidiphilus]|uniref:alpha/beta hydrolase family protein n=1 Tax=Hymenobacter sp. CCM 8763 TaxID=2303334 RepID=UPI000E3491A2|nr:prolyl oligopeptidase family serine peptidase [Hymenobacter sp. CCM 8763]RFP65780.1 S9 family peptidase [Hymenobacter sp. CCM 8763]
MRIHILTLALSALTVGHSLAQALPYQLPPRPLAALADAPPMPRASFSPNGQWLLQLDMQERPTVFDQSQPELRLAGLRINTTVSGRSRMAHVRALRLRQLPKGLELLVQGLPANARISNLQWSPDNTKIAFTHSTRDHLELWVVDVVSASARLVPNIFLNGTLGMPYEWVSDSKALVVRAVVGGRGNAPVAAPVGAGRQYEYPVKTPLDEQQLGYYALSQVVRVGLDGRMAPLGQPGLIAKASPSPDGRFVLVRSYRRPYPTTLPLDRFPQRVQVLAMDGLLDKQLADLPAVESLPEGLGAVPTGPREFGWREDVPNTVFWVEARDGGNPAQAAPVRDQLLTLAAPFEEPARELVALPARFRRIYWGNEQLVLVEGTRLTDRRQFVWPLDILTKTLQKPLLEYPERDAYAHPGTPVLQPNAQGRPVLLTDRSGTGVYLFGAGASSEGDRPFIDELSVRTRASQRWWRSEAPYYEQPVLIIDPAKRTFITKRESDQQSPNYHLRTGPKLVAITQFADPYAGLGSLPRMQPLRYQRPDGRPLMATLYLPAGYQTTDGPLPTIMEVGPAMFYDSTGTSQMRGSQHTFARYNWGSPLYWTAQGYAVLQGVPLPVPSGKAATPAAYAQKLVQAAGAALAEGRRMGFIDTARVVVLGQGPGASLATSLLAESRLFKAGIALPGLFNQPAMGQLPGEEQKGVPTEFALDYALAPLAPFGLPDTLRRPLLVMPAGFDGIPASLATRTEQLYSELQRLGGTSVNYATLPGETHGYTARESLMQLLAQMNTWFDTYIKPTAASQPATSLPTSSK